MTYIPDAILREQRRAEERARLKAVAEFEQDQALIRESLTKRTEMDRAQAHELALRMLAEGATQGEVRRRTGCSEYIISRWAREAGRGKQRGAARTERSIIARKLMVEQGLTANAAAKRCGLSPTSLYEQIARERAKHGA